MKLYFSASTGGFYQKSVHAGVMPADAVAISEKRHRDLLEGQAVGHRIVVGPLGKPVLEPTTNPDIAAARRAAVVAVKREARRRILAIASLEKQSNDNAAMALGVAPEARERRRQIDAIRAASGGIEATIAASSLAQLSTFNTVDDSLWFAKDS